MTSSSTLQPISGSKPLDGGLHVVTQKLAVCVFVCVCHRPHIHVLCEGLLQLEVRCFSVVTPDRCFVCFLQPF